MFNGPVFNNEVVQANSRAVSNAGFSESLDEANSLHSRLTGASFELVPSSYKGGVVYSGVPNAGNGDLTWTRASDAWRTNADGLIQRVPWNLLQQSNAFSTSPWSLVGTPTLTANYAANPLTGANDAWRFQSASGSDRVVQVVGGSLNTFSLYAKGTGVLRLRDSTGNYITDLTLTSTWQRITVYITAAFTNVQITSNAGCDATIYGAQLVEGSNALPYFPTTDRLNVPRVSYEYGSSPALLLEPQRTNISTQSTIAAFGTAANDWVIGSNIPAVVNQTTGIDGRFTGTRYTKTSGATVNDYLYKKEIPVTSGTVYTISGYIKLGTASNAVIVANNGLAWNTVTNGTFVCTTANGFSTTEWKRFAMTVTAPATGKINIHYGYHIEVGLPAQTDGTFFLDGLQVEQGAYATTLIPTVATTVTRLSDFFTRNNIYTNGLITAAGGTWFTELRGNLNLTGDGGGDFIVLSDQLSTTGNAFRFYNPPSLSRMMIYKIVASTGTPLYTTTTDTVKVAIKWNGVTADVFVSGVKVVSATSFTTTNMQNLVTGITAVPRSIQQMALFPTPLSDDQCVALTSDFTEGESVIGSYERYVNSNGGAVENLNTITNLIQNLK